MASSKEGGAFDPSFAIVTPTYLPDLSRCELLAESLDRCAPEVPHYLIVDRRDRKDFAHLARGKRRILESEEFVGKWLWRMPGRKGLWLSLKAPPVRGWILQQILKIAAIDRISEKLLLFCDSDTAFFRRFDRNDLLVGGKPGLLDVDFVNADIRRWTIAARSLLGLPQSDADHHGHVGNMICWDRTVVYAMRERIEAVVGRPWQQALARMPSFSEYMLYGIFVREVMGYEASGQSPSDVPLVKASWGSSLSDDDAIADFFATFDPRSVAVMVHSKDGVDPKRFRHHLEQRWAGL